MLSYEVVGYAPRSPRDWYIHGSLGLRSTAEVVAGQLMGGSPLFQGVRPAVSMPNQELVGITAHGPVTIVVWSGQPDTAFAWHWLERRAGCARFSVSVTPAAHSMEARWDDADGRLLRHVVIAGGELVTDEGDAQLVDEHADTDDSLEVFFDRRLPAAVVRRLLADVSEQEAKVHNRRRYARTNDLSVLEAARVVHTDQGGRTWVAVDQTGQINTLWDPLSALTGQEDPDELANDVVKAWFDIDMSSEQEFPVVCRFAWPDAPSSRT